MRRMARVSGVGRRTTHLLSEGRLSVAGIFSDFARLNDNLLALIDHELSDFAVFGGKVRRMMQDLG